MDTFRVFPSSRLSRLPLAALLGIAAMLWIAAPAAVAAPAPANPTCEGCVELSPSPPEQTTAVPPNLMLLLDDSGSMRWDVMPDWGFLNSRTSSALINAANNGVYYDPTVTYAPPPKADGSTYPDASFPNAWRSGFTPENASGSWNNGTWGPKPTGTVDLERYDGSKDMSTTSYMTDSKVTYSRYGTSGWWPNQTSYGAFRYATGPSNTVHYVSTGCSSMPSQYQSACVDAGDTSGKAAPEGVAAGQNVANWYSYYHTRALMAKSALMMAFAGLPKSYRFGYGSINKNSDKDVARFGDGSNGTQKQKFWDWLSDEYPNGNTPLRIALNRVGQYYQTAQPWQTMEGDPNYNTDSKGKELACRASSTILTTDGFWNRSYTNTTVKGQAGAGGTSPAAPDGHTIALPDGPPFKGGTYSGGSLADVAAYYWRTDLRGSVDNLVPPAGDTDPAFWQHMTTYTMGMGFTASGISGEAPSGNSPPTSDDIFAWAHDINANPARSASIDSPLKIDGFSWPTIVNGGESTVADLEHAAVTGRGAFFSAESPQEMAQGLAKAITQISKGAVAPQRKAQNNSVGGVFGALQFAVGYSSVDWTGTLIADNSLTGETEWNFGKKLDTALAGTGWSDRAVYTALYDGVDCSGSTASGGSFKEGAVFDTTTSFDCFEEAGLTAPTASPSQSDDTLAHRVDYLLGDQSFEGALYRERASQLGAIIHSQPVYLSFPNGNYRNVWPDKSAESDAVDSGKGYNQFKIDHADREGVVYVGANDGMLHAFRAPVPDCSPATNSSVVNDMNCEFASDGGEELWAYVPRAVYPNLGNLTQADFHYRPTVDAIPAVRDVYFDSGWTTLLVSGVGLGGRGVFALDVTAPTKFSADDVLWEFDSDTKIGTSCTTNNRGACKATDLGYTVPAPNIGRLGDGEGNGRWVVLVSSGYFPDCKKPDVPTGEPENADRPVCEAIAAQAPEDSDGSPYSALFVLDAKSGDVLAELKTPENVKSYGLGPAVLGDYEHDQIDDVAFAGDLQGNLWRFDLRGNTPSDWSVSLAYQGTTADSDGAVGDQPITSMPRLFPDLFSNRFQVVFGTGKYLGVGDNSTSTPTQSVYGIREQVDASGDPVTRDQLTRQTLTEKTIGGGDLAGATMRQVSNAEIDTDSGNGQGWYVDFNLPDAPGERVIVTPGAIFATNTVVVETLIPNMNNYCDPTSHGAVMFMKAANGGPAANIKAGDDDDETYIGGRITQASTGGTVPVVSRLGGGSAYVPVSFDTGESGPGGGPGHTGSTGGSNIDPSTPSVGTPIWRRRSWSILKTSDSK